jgi:hypothetical protein
MDTEYTVRSQTLHETAPSDVVQWTAVCLYSGGRGSKSRPGDRLSGEVLLVIIILSMQVLKVGHDSFLSTSFPTYKYNLQIAVPPK